MRSTNSRRRLVILAACFVLALTLPAVAQAATGTGADINGDGVVNLADIGLFASLFFSPTYDPRVDLDCDGVISLADIGLFAQAL
mgnify:CR=1 FL=1